MEMLLNTYRWLIILFSTNVIYQISVGFKTSTSIQILNHCFADWILGHCNKTHRFISFVTKLNIDDNECCLKYYKTKLPFVISARGHIVLQGTTCLSLLLGVFVSVLSRGCFFKGSFIFYFSSMNCILANRYTWY